MFNELNLNKIYTDFDSKEIKNDINQIYAFISDLSNILTKIVKIKDVEKFIEISNNTIVLIDKIASFSRLHLYLNTNNTKAVNLLNKIEEVEIKFKKIQSKFLNNISLTTIEEYSSNSECIYNHKYILKQLKFNDYNINFSYNSKYEQEYNKLISSNKITINQTIYPINYNSFDFLINNKLNKIKNNYLQARNDIFYLHEEDYANILFNIKNKTNNLIKSLGFSTPLEMSLFSAGLNMTTLNALLNSIENNRNIFSKYLDSDFSILSDNKLYTIDDAKNAIYSAFLLFDTSLFKLAFDLFNNQLINLDNNKDKIIGSCHLKILFLKESRIVGHFNGKIKDIFQIAHELGHAYQNYLIMHSQTPLNSNVPTSTCEIISTFCELLVLDYLLRETANLKEKKIILSNFINYSIQAILDIYARFLFEDEIFNLINNGAKSLDYNYLNELMLKSQMESYGNSKYLDEHLWIYKPHFYSISAPYYNYSYALGLLYALVLFDNFKKMPRNKFVNLFTSFCQKSGCSDFFELSSLFDINSSDKMSFNSAFALLNRMINDYLSL